MRSLDATGNESSRIPQQDAPLDATGRGWIGGNRAFNQGVAIVPPSNSRVVGLHISWPICAARNHGPPPARTPVALSRGVPVRCHLGANTTIFSLVNCDLPKADRGLQTRARPRCAALVAIMLCESPMERPEEVVYLYLHLAYLASFEFSNLSYANFEDVRERHHCGLQRPSRPSSPCRRRWTAWRAATSTPC